MPGERGDPPIELPPLRLNVGDQHPHPRGQGAALVFSHQHDEIMFEFALDLRHANPTFQQDCAQLVDQSGSLANQAIPGPVQRLHIKLRRGLDFDEAHRWPRCCLRYPLGVTIVVLLRLDIRAHVFGRHQTHVVSLSREQPAQMMGAATSLHPDNARR